MLTFSYNPDEEAFEKLVRKVGNASKQNFLFLPQCFLP